MIDKNKAYRFRGDSERWVYECNWWWCGDRTISKYTAEHLHERGILLEYPELPGEDWEFCEARDADFAWDDAREWVNTSYVSDCGTGIYCRKKKPVYRSGCINPGGIDMRASLKFTDNETVYWTTDPEKGKELLS